METFKTVINIANNSLGSGLVALLTAGGEQIFSTVVVKCPCNQLNFIYGLVFLLVPALALLTLGLILSKKTWQLVTGLCSRQEKVCGSCGQAKSLAMVLFQISTMAFMAPVTWIAVALLNGVLTECAMTGTNTTFFNNHLCKGREKEADCVKELHMFPCGKNGTVPKDVREEVLLMLRAESQVCPVKLLHRLTWFTASSSACS
uniref:Calcium homeostasis modulator family member 6 n=1 Tax=Neogobius melanostomus TaxID=47308 RepID=A0A8C6SM66_9GOBI